MRAVRASFGRILRIKSTSFKSLALPLAPIRSIHTSAVLKAKKKPLNPETKKTLIFELHHPETVGALAEVLKAFERKNINLLRIESRPTLEQSVAFTIDFDAGLPAVRDVMTDLAELCSSVTLVGKGAGTDMEHFPRRPRDLDALSTKVLEMGAELSATIQELKTKNTVKEEMLSPVSLLNTNMACQFPPLNTLNKKSIHGELFTRN